ncbi:hypothetical protein B0J18DRAFT_50732 [Chaetomium sp. MPI-SDFR-AT-0129]|nr:hypothetical protein B0J18DRAFT_50732 [Chaetomium sp. MPI-SDFR-AT-0129]
MLRLPPRCLEWCACCVVSFGCRKKGFCGMFRVGCGQRCGASQNTARIDQLSGLPLAGKEIIYTHDFGDNWEHHITVEGWAEAANYSVYLSGTGHRVAGDVGGVKRWDALKVAYRASRPNKDQREKREWFENDASNADPAGLVGDQVNVWDMEQVTHKLRVMLEEFARAAGQDRGVTQLGSVSDNSVFRLHAIQTMQCQSPPFLCWQLLAEEKPNPGSIPVREEPRRLARRVQQQLAPIPEQALKPVGRPRVTPPSSSSQDLRFRNRFRCRRSVSLFVVCLLFLRRPGA